MASVHDVSSDDSESRLRLRAKIERAIDRLIAALDAIDGDPDLEDSDEDRAVDDLRCDEADSGDDEPGHDDQDVCIAAFVMDQTRGGEFWR